MEYKFGIILVVGIICIGSKVKCDADFTCGGTIDTNKTTINATNYPSDKTCVWRFTYNSTQKYFAFQVFDLDKGDYLQLFHGNTSDDETLLTAKFNGSKTPFLAATFSSVATLVLHSGPTQGASTRSFQIQYLTKRCELYVKKKSAVVTSPIYSPSSAGSLNCTYHVSTENNDEHVALSFDSLNLTKGSLRVWDGDSWSPQPVINVTGMNRLSDIVSTKQNLRIETSLPTIKVENFSATFISELKVCPGGIVNLTNATNITSPGFPSVYSNNMDCRWIIKAPENYTIKIDIQEVDLADTADKIDIVDRAAKISGSLATIFQGYKQRGLLMTSNNMLMIRFRTDESLTGKGFSITLVPQKYGGFAKDSGQISFKQKHDNPIFTTYGDVKNDTTLTIPVYFLLQATEGLQIRLELNDSFMMPFSTVDIWDGSNVNGTLIGHYSTFSQAYPVISTKGQMLVVLNGFLSNNSESGQYFIANFTSVKPGQQISLSGDSGSASLRESSLNNSATYLLINPSSDRVLSLEIDNLYLPVNASFTIYQDVSESSAKVLTLNGSADQSQLQTIPKLYLSQARLVYSLNSTQAVSPQRILLSFSFQVTPKCGEGELSKDQGSLMSPLYPNQYPAYSMCTWTFIPVQNKQLRLNFKDVNLGAGHSVTVEADHYHVGENGTQANMTREVLSVLNGSMDAIPDLIVVMNNNSLNTTKVKVTFNSSYQEKNSLHVGPGFDIEYQHLSCGGNFTNGSADISTPGFPKPVDADFMECIWVIDIPSRPESDNTSVNIISFKFTVKDFVKNTNTSETKLRIHDGGSDKEPEVVLAVKEGDSAALLSRSNRLWIHYTHNRTKGDPGKGFAFSLKYTTNVCGSKDLCDNGMCMHTDWKCNGIDECGDDSDEKDCFHATNTVSRLVLGFSIVITFIIATALACIVPALYKRMKYPNYSELRDLMTPVPT